MPESRFELSVHEVARRIDIDDLPGFLGKDLTVFAGTRAAFYESGRFVGVLDPGTHAVRSTFQSLFFWNPGNCSALVVRQGDLPLEFAGLKALTTDLQEVEVSLHLMARVADLGLLNDNLLRGRDQLLLAELKPLVEPLVVQAVTEGVGRLSLKDLVGPEARANLDTMVSQALQVLRRYGLEFVRVHTVSLCHPEYDTQRRRTGQLWLAREGLANDEAARQLELDRRLAGIRLDEDLADLDNLARDVATDAAQGRLANLRRRIGLRKDLRAAFQAGTFDKLKTEAELQAFLRQRDAERLLAQAEHDRLIATLGEQRADRETQRQHLLERLRIEQEFDLQEFRAELEQGRKLKSLEHQAELARRGASEETLRFQEELARSTREQTARHELQLKELEHLRHTTRAGGELRRTDEWEEVLHRQRVSQVEGDMELAGAQRQRQIALIEIELSTARQRSQVELDQRKAEWNLTRWKEIRSVKAAAEREADDREFRERESQRKSDLERLQTQGKLTPEQLLALGPGNAAVLGEVLKEQARQAAQAGSNEQLQRLQTQLNEAVQQRDAGAVAALQQALQAAQANFQHLGGVVETITRNLAPKPGTTVVLPGQGGTVPGDASSASAPVRVLLCAGCRAELRPEQRFCPQCGKQA